MTVKREEKASHKQQNRFDKNSKTQGPMIKGATKFNKGDDYKKRKHHEVQDGEEKPKFDKKNASKAPVLNRRQKQKVSDLIKKLRINYNRLLIKKKELGNEEKHTLVAESIEMIGDKYTELCFKHDGCRVLQALIKYGNRP